MSHPSGLLQLGVGRVITRNTGYVDPTVWPWRGYVQGRKYSPQTRNVGGPKGQGALCRCEKKDIVALGLTSAYHLILIHQEKQGYVNRRNAT